MNHSNFIMAVLKYPNRMPVTIISMRYLSLKCHMKVLTCEENQCFDSRQRPSQNSSPFGWRGGRCDVNMVRHQKSPRNENNIHDKGEDSSDDEGDPFCAAFARSETSCGGNCVGVAIDVEHAE